MSKVGDEPWLPPLSWTGDGITLRIYKPDDAVALTEAVTESYEHLKPWMAWAKRDQTIQESEQICRRAASRYLEDSDFTLGAWDGEKLIGGTGFHLRCGPPSWKCAEIGMWVRASYNGQGWATRILAQMLEWGFTEWGWERLIWKCDTRNIGSLRVAEKCGMKREATCESAGVDAQGERCDMHYYGILKDQWMKPV